MIVCAWLKSLTCLSTSSFNRRQTPHDHSAIILWEGLVVLAGLFAVIAWRRRRVPRHKCGVDTSNRGPEIAIKSGENGFAKKSLPTFDIFI
jgi:MYXO-CTERM domain-containing protein